jgi:hypothetical protein
VILDGLRLPSAGHLFFSEFHHIAREASMSVSDFEEHVFTYLWRGLVLAGLVTMLWSVLVPAPNPKIQPQSQGETNTASSRVHPATAANQER